MDEQVCGPLAAAASDPREARQSALKTPFEAIGG
jgi:hypothetical protein